MTNFSTAHIEELFKQVSSSLASGVEAVAALIIALAVIEATWRVLKVFFTRPAVPDEMKEDVRLRLARWLAVALEFEVAADILRTAITPTWDDIGKLAAIAALRTILNYFLQKEIEANSHAKSVLPGKSPIDVRTLLDPAQHSGRP